LRVVNQSGQVAVDDVSFSVRSGEIYAVAGVQGNGQTELTESLMGLNRPTAGRIRIDGDDVTRESVDRILSRGVGYVPEDRSHDGMVAGFTIAENLVLDIFDQAPFAKGMSLDLKSIDDNAEHRVQEFDIRTPSIHANASTLSGGNQQKLVLARELSRPLRILVVAQPTRGVDVGSQEFVHRRIIEERDSGAAVVLISSELDEVLALADRIAVMYRGRIIGEVPAGTSAEQIGLLMAGAGNDSAQGGPASGTAGEAP
jgi:simple sugar transport system ATP-binding protein